MFRRVVDCLSLTYIVAFFKRQTSSAEYTACFVCAPSVCIVPQQLRDLLLSHSLQLPVVVVMLQCKLVPYIAIYGRGIVASFLGPFAILRKATFNSVCAHGTIRLPLAGFS